MERLIGEDPALAVAASVASAEELDGLDPSSDVVALALSPGSAVPALAAIEWLARVSRVLVISGWDHGPSPVAVFKAGASGCVTRHSDPASIRAGLEAVARGGMFVCRQLAAGFQAELERAVTADTSSCLAPREIETLQWIAQGLTHGQVARRMGVSEATINTYAKRLRAKLNVGNKAQLTQMAIKLGHLSEA